MSGTGRSLHEQNADIQVIGTTFDLPQKPWADAALSRHFHRLPGYEDLKPDWPDNIDLHAIDRLEARAKSEVIDFGFELARTEGPLLGPSSVLSVKVALQLAARSGPDDVFVVFSADYARDYTGAEYDEDWLRAHVFADLGHRRFGSRAEQS
ncbi:hypothetical protein B1729_05245 [Microbacterium sp. B35-04]|nr:hypothetical protein [Microbacterium sp. B35-04]KAF2414323.1 hypothetical protein B1729_05245 [Microbacterium sp. B35-04]